MPAIYKTTTTELYQEIRAASEASGETNGCAVVALAILCETTYAKAHDALAKHGRKVKNGTYIAQYRAASADLGFTMVRFDPERIRKHYPKPHQTLKSVGTTHHPRRFPEAWKDAPPLLLSMRKHIAAFREGKVHDWTINNTKRITEMYEMRRKG